MASAICSSIRRSISSKEREVDEGGPPPMCSSIWPVGWLYYTVDLYYCLFTFLSSRVTGGRRHILIFQGDLLLYQDCELYHDLRGREQDLFHFVLGTAAVAFWKRSSLLKPAICPVGAWFTLYAVESCQVKVWLTEDVPADLGVGVPHLQSTKGIKRELTNSTLADYKLGHA